MNDLQMVMDRAVRHATTAKAQRAANKMARNLPSFDYVVVPDGAGQFIVAMHAYSGDSAVLGPIVGYLVNNKI